MNFEVEIQQQSSPIKTTRNPFDKRVHIKRTNVQLPVKKSLAEADLVNGFGGRSN